MNKKHKGKQKSIIILMGVYALVLSMAATITGILMLQSNYGIFSEYPVEWLSILPFQSWIGLGVLVIIIFGLGNLTVAILCLWNKGKEACAASALMGFLLMGSGIIQVIIIGEWYMATMQILAAGLIQVCLSITGGNSVKDKSSTRNFVPLAQSLQVTKKGMDISMMKKEPLVGFTKVLLDIMFYAGIVVCISIPILFWYAKRFYEPLDIYYIPFSIIFILSGIFALRILWELRRMFGTVIKGDPFVTENVTSLRRMGISAFVISVCMAFRLFFEITAASLILILVFLIAGLFSLVLSQVFKQAVTFKQENDLTI